MKTQIITSAHTKLIERDAQRYILMEDYLKYSNKDLFENRECQVIRKAYDDGTYGDGQKYIDALVYKLLKVWRENIRKVYNISLSERQSEIIIAPYLRMVSCDLLYRYNKMSRVRDEEDVFVNVIKTYPHETYMADSVRNIYLSDDKQNFLWGFVAERLGIPVYYILDNSEEKCDEVRKLDRIHEIVGKIIQNPAMIRRYMRKILTDFKKRFFIHVKTPCKEARVILLQTLLGDEVEKQFKIRSDGCIDHMKYQPMWSRNRKIIDRRKNDDRLRDEIWNTTSLDNDEFAQLVLEFLKFATPRGYIEAFADLYYDAQKIASKSSAEKIYSAYTSIEYIDIYEALMSEKGTEICEIQHSATYPGEKYKISSELMHGDVFCTWGWEADNFEELNCKIKRVSMIRLPKMVNRENCDKKEKILYAINFLMKGDLAGGNYSNYLSNQMDFIDALNEKTRRKLALRVDPNETYNTILVNECKKKYPYIQIESRYDISFSESLKESKLLICDYYGSPMLEALMLGEKFMMFEGAEIQESHACLQKYLTEFEKAGIYYKDGKQIAQALNTIEDYDVFLQPNQQIFDSFLKEFANPGDDVYEQWYNEFIS